MKKFLLAILFLILLANPVFASPGAEKRDCKKWDATSVAINTDWLSSACQAGHFTESVRYTIQVSCPTSTTVTVFITTSRSDTSASLTKSGFVNGGSALTAASFYNYSFLVPPGGNWNIQHATATQTCDLLTFESLDLNQ